MCGIVGCLMFDNSLSQIKKSHLLGMRDAMKHRGPDGAGVWISDDFRVGLAHRRLSILDLSERASQPMRSANGLAIVSFNGEIYNHAEIRVQLEKTGKYSWETDHSDTEVILHAYEEWGINCINRFRGMFAIAIWDAHERCLWLIRDRSGIKPLYYSLRYDRIVFASEIKALLKDPEQGRSVNERGFFDYLSFLCVPAPDTLFHGIQKVPNGCWLKISADGKTKENRYWDVLDHLEDLQGVPEDYLAGRLLSELRESVTIRKMADVPVGVFLSGGIDSSTNAVLFSEGEKKRLDTFSVGYDGYYKSYTNELNYARFVGELIKANYHEAILTSEDLMNFLPEMVRLQDEPIGDPVCMPVHFLSRLSRSVGVPVCQVGEGADELFWGYNSWKKSLVIQNLSDLPVPFGIRKGFVGMLSALGLDKDWKFELLKRSSNRLPVFWSGAEALTHNQKMSLLSKRLKSKYRDASSWDAIEPIWNRYSQKIKKPHGLSWMSYVDLNMRLPELLLMRVDKMSMGASVEARVPFLDHKFVEFAMSIPSEVKTKSNELKYILKLAVQDVIPQEIITRKKQGFAAPIAEWFDGKLGDVAASTLKEFCLETDLLDWPAVNRLLKSRKKGSAWHLFNAAVWWKEYLINS